MASSDVKQLELRLKKLESSHRTLQKLVHLYTFAFVTIAVALLSALWYAKNTFLPQLVTVISTLRSANSFFRDRASSLPSGVDTLLDHIENFMGKRKT